MIEGSPNCRVTFNTLSRADRFDPFLSESAGQVGVAANLREANHSYGAAGLAVWAYESEWALDGHIVFGLSSPKIITKREIPKSAESSSSTPGSPKTLHGERFYRE